MDDADQTEIKTSYVSEEMSKGSPYDVSGQIPDSITYEGQSYAKDTVKGATSGTLTGNVEITAIYSLEKSAARMAATVSGQVPEESDLPGGKRDLGG